MQEQVKFAWLQIFVQNVAVKKPGKLYEKFNVLRKLTKTNE